MDCPTCGAQATYLPDYDAQACLSCDSWLELTCDAEVCWACSDRPHNPSLRRQKPEQSEPTTQGDRHFLNRVIRLIPQDQQPAHTRENYAALAEWFRSGGR